MDNVTVKEIQLSNGSIEEQVFIESDSGVVIMPKSVYDTLPSESSIPTTPQAGE